MDRATGLEALAEEEDEEYGISDDSISDDDEQGDGGVRKGEPNKFDALCDGVINATSLVHASLTELLDLKDELLKHALPPNVLMKIALCTTKVFRSASDMSSPVNELLRMVRLYSTPWEEKSAALKKLHEDYNSKKDQLNIAVKRLQLIDAHSRRIAKERRILNWEKLFSKLSATKGHGRRWKFLIEPFKRKVTDGPEALQSYVEEMEHESDQSDGEDDKEVDTQMQHVIPSPSEEPASIEPNQEDSDNDETEDDSEMKESDTESVDSGQKREKDVVPIYIKPPMKDKECWTHEPKYQKYLHVRVYKPEGLEYRELRCYITYGKVFHKTNILDPLPQEEDKKDEPEPPASTRGGRPIRGRGRGRGLANRGGKSAGRPGAARGAHLLHPQEQAKEERKEGPLYEEVTFHMPEEMQHIRPKSRKSSSDIGENESDHLKIAVHYGPKEEMVAMATIEKEDLDTLDLPVVDMKPPEGDKFPAEREEYVPTPGPRTTPSDSSIDKETDKVIKDVQPVNFPLYSIHAGKSDAMHLPLGQLPLVCFWARQLQPDTFERATDSETIRDIVYDTTGFDIDVVTKADLHKEMREQCVSAMSFASEPKETDGDGEEEEQEQKPEDSVPKSQYDRLMQTHRDEMESLQEEYEQKLQDLVEQFQQIQEAMMEAQSASNSPQMMMIQENVKNGEDRQQRMSPAISIPAQSKPRRSKTHPSHSEMLSKKNFSIAKPLPVWGENLPKDFFERLKLFEEESKKHQQENTDKTNKEMREMLEKKFAAEFKLSTTGNDQSNAMEDVCLPAVFMPSTTSSKAAVYNPRAAKYFHPTGAGGVRLTQPPSMVQLPPIPKNKLSVVNLFDVAKNFQRGGNQWLMDKYLQSQPRERSAQPRTPLQTFASTNNFPDSFQPSAVHEANSMTVGSSPMKEAMVE